MIKVNIKKSDGTELKADMLTFFEVLNVGKKYVFYTLNEVVEDNMMKMYVAEVVEAVNGITIGGNITDEEWTNLKTIMKAILTNGQDPNIKYLKVGVE